MNVAVGLRGDPEITTLTNASLPWDCRGAIVRVFGHPDQWFHIRHFHHFLIVLFEEHHARQGDEASGEFQVDTILSPSPRVWSFRRLQLVSSNRNSCA